MPPRDDQEFESRRQQIIDGALEVFAQKGFEKATNKDIASAAGIGSPGLIYHYFKDKADLFRQMMEHRAPSLELLLHADEMMDLPPRDVLTRVGKAFVQTVEDRSTMAMLRIVFSEVTRRPAVAQIINTIGPGRGIAFLMRYLEHQMELGNLRRVDPGVAARCFIGPLMAFMATREIFPQPDSRTLSAETMVTQAIEFFLRGMSPDSDAAP